MPSSATPTTPPRIGATFAGYGGLDEAVAKVFGGKVAWVSEFDAAPSRILAHHYPDAPNHGDITKIEWDDVEPIELFTGGYPCFPTGTLILTREGWKPIEKVRAGDEVFTHRNRWRPVVRNWGARLGKTVTIKGQGHEGLVATDNHKFPVREKALDYNASPSRGNGRFVLSSESEKVEAKDLKGKFWATPTDFPDEQIPPVGGMRIPVDENSEAFWWVVGMYLADGSLSARRAGTDAYRAVRFADATGQAADLTKQKLAEAGLQFGVTVTGSVTTLQISSTALACWLETHFGHGASTKTMPSWVYGIPEHLRRALFDGYIHGDGHDLPNGGVRFNSVSKTLAISMRMIAQTLGYYTSVNLVAPASTKVIEGRTVNQKPWWRVTCNLDSRTAVHTDGHQWGKVRSVEYTGLVEKVWNLEVADDNTYVVEGMVAANCQPFSHAGKRKGKDDSRHLFPYFARAVEKLRPRIVVAENVRGHLSLGFDVVMAEWVRVGYDVQWVMLRAADVGAPHGRARVFIMATDPEKEPKLEGKGRAFAELVDGQWVEPGEALFGLIPFKGKWPTAGRLVDGVVYDNTDMLGDIPAAISRYLGGVVGSVEHVLPTPSAADGMGGHKNRSGARSGELLLPGVAAAIGEGQLLPTPRATRGGSGTETIYALGGERSDDERPQGTVLLPTPTASLGNGHSPARDRSEGMRLDEAAVLNAGEGALLKTPTAQLAVNGGSQHPDKRKEGGHGPTLADEVEHLLPTPTTINRTSQKAKTGRPTSGASRGGPSYGLEDILEPGGQAPGALLPTPRASDGEKGGPNQRGSSGDLMLPSAVVQLLPTPVVNDMGKAYTPAEWDEWTAKLKADHGNGNGHGASLEIEAARLAEPELLPTPVTGYTASTAEQWRARRPAGNGGVRERVGDLRIVTEELLGEDAPAGESNVVDDGALIDVPAPAPSKVSNVVVPGYEKWGQYALAVRRWEIISGRVAPDATAPTGKGGAQRLSPRFVEWMMGLEDGWLTDPEIWDEWTPSAARNAQLKALGNGVVPRQAETAIRLMLATR